MTRDLSEDYWLTEEGIDTRLNLLSLYFSWQLYSYSLASTLEIQAEEEGTTAELIWVNHPELSQSGPCIYCMGLHGLHFTVGEEPPFPAHAKCVCDLDYVFTKS